MLLLGGIILRDFVFGIGRLLCLLLFWNSYWRIVMDGRLVNQGGNLNRLILHRYRLLFQLDSLLLLPVLLRPENCLQILLRINLDGLVFYRLFWLAEWLLLHHALFLFRIVQLSVILRFTIALRFLGVLNRHIFLRYLTRSLAILALLVEMIGGSLFWFWLGFGLSTLSRASLLNGNWQFERPHLLVSGRVFYVVTRSDVFLTLARIVSYLQLLGGVERVDHHVLIAMLAFHFQAWLLERADRA